MTTHARTPVRRITHRLGFNPLSLLVGALLTGVVGCGPLEEPGVPSLDLGVGSATQALTQGNELQLSELGFNGLAFNGLAFNGLAFNGLAFNGLAFNGLATTEFSTWFQQNPALSNVFMKYLVRCAVPAGETRTYTDGAGTSYTWYGNLGLAPTWAGGSPATVEEQQLVTGCLAALANKYGRSVGVSVLGAKAQGEPIPSTAEELADYSEREACFFGNLFTDTGLFVGNDQPLLPTTKSSLRACALGSTNSATSSECPPLVHVGSCQASCQLDPTGTYYTRCRRNGVTYRPITTRIRPQEIVTCGDGICQPSESCGTGILAASCGVDCGACTGVSISLARGR